MLKRWIFLILILVLFSVNVLAEDTVVFNGTILDITLVDGKGNDVVDLSKYFFSNNSVEYKYKVGQFGMEGLAITIGGDGKVDMEATSKSVKSVFFVADDDITSTKSNEVSVYVTGGVQEIAFSPNTATVEIKEGEKQVFGVSGVSENQSVRWYVDDVLLNYSEGTYEFIGEEVKVYNIKVEVREVTRSWSVSVLSKAIVDRDVSEGDVFEEEREGPVCGNGVREAGENCENCPADVRCASNSRCEGGVCVPVKSYFNLILWLVLLVAAIVFIVAGVILVRRKGWFKKGESVSGKTAQRVAEKEGKEGFVSKIKGLFKRKEKLVSVQEEPQPVQREPVQKPVQQPQSVLSAQLMPLVNYFKTNMAKYKIGDLVKQALKQGWTREQINKVLAWIRKK